MYELCIPTISQALKLLKTETEALRLKLTARMVKSYLYIKQAHKAQQALSRLPTSHPEHTLLGIATGQALAITSNSQTQSHEDWGQLVDFPRYRPIL